MLNPLPALAQGQSVVVASGSSGLPMTYTVVGPATLNGTVLRPTGPGAITVAAYQDGDAAWEAAEPVMQTVVLAGTAQHWWRQMYFGAAANTGAVGDGYDADADGLANLVEYGFGLNPVAGGSRALPQPQREGGSFTVNFAQPAGVTGVTYGASYSASLLPGSWISIPDTGTGGNHVFSAPVGGETELFIRLEVTAGLEGRTAEARARRLGVSPRRRED